MESAVIGIAGTKSPLCKHALSGAPAKLVPILMGRIPSHDSKKTYEDPPEAYDYHYIVEHRIVYMVAVNRESSADKRKQQLRIAFCYLDDIKGKFREEFGKGGYPDVNQLSEGECARFNKTLGDRMKYVLNNDQILLANKNIEDIQDVMCENIEKVIERGEKVEALETQTRELEHESTAFRKKSNKLKTTMKWRDRRFAMVIGAIVLIIIVIIVIYFTTSGDDE
eukprot:TRINITY_DN3475_c0_g5_i1.p2 TRINITY_DN3475_c0_g5~~TRINITY_DN3475_c0_g5_i1.p2  ORF type:complete len:224 (+),score=112.10 TRINITY_DN3475_c0_g5_i1:76-747(+)